MPGWQSAYLPMKKRPSARTGVSRGSAELGLCACGLPAINKNLKCAGCLREANKRYLATKPPSRVCACGKRVQVARQCGACYQRDHPEEWRQRLVKRRKQDAARRMQNSGVAVSTRSLCSCGEPIYIGSMCANCFAESAGDLEATLLQEAEERRRSQICSTGKPTGLEPALQSLVLPKKTVTFVCTVPNVCVAMALQTLLSRFRCAVPNGPTLRH